MTATEPVGPTPVPVCCRARLRARAAANAPTVRRSLLASMPGIALALLPKFTCPACWPLWASVFPSLGQWLVLDERILLLLLVVFLLPAVAMFAIGAQQRRGLGPFVVGLLGATIVVAARSGFASGAVERCGLLFFVAAAVWNAWPRRCGAAQHLTRAAASPRPR